MADQPTSGNARPAQPGPVRRMTFEYDGDQIRLVSEQHVRMIVPPSQPLEQTSTHGSLQVLLRDHQNQLVHRSMRNSPIRHDTEVFSPPGMERSVERMPVARPKGTFVLLVPDVQGAETLELVGHPPPPPGMGLATPEGRAASLAAPQTLARFTLKPFKGK